MAPAPAARRDPIDLQWYSTARYRVRLDGWASSPDWRLAHFVKDNRAICEVPTAMRGLKGVTRELVARGASKALAVHMIGNGVPLAMATTIARGVRRALHEAVA